MTLERIFGNGIGAGATAKIDRIAADKEAKRARLSPKNHFVETRLSVVANNAGNMVLWGQTSSPEPSLWLFDNLGTTNAP
jgi:hypothetical protein